MFWNGQKIVDLSRVFLDTSGCSKYQKARIAHLQGINSNSIEFNEENFYKILAEKNTASQKGLVEMFDSTVGATTVTLPFGGKYRDWETDRKSTRLNSSHRSLSRMPSSA